MTLRELTIEEFTQFQQRHELSNYYQTINYAMIKAENEFEYDMIGLINDYNEVVAAALILFKKIGNKWVYGYSPRGFLIDYKNEELVKLFTSYLRNYYSKKNVVFIKINPNIIIGKVNTEDEFKINYNENKNILNTLEMAGIKKLKNNMYFEAQLPRFNGILDLRTFITHNLEKNTKNKIKKGIRKGLTFEKCTKDKISEFYNIMKSKKNRNEFYYQDFYTVFEKNDNVDLFLVSIDYNSFLQNSQYVYNEELERNTRLNEKLTTINSEKLINNKMNSDKILLSYKNDIMEASKGISDNKHIYIAGAMVIKHNDTANILFSGYDTAYKRFAPNYFLHYNLIKYYQPTHDYLDLNGLVGDFKNENPYTGLNRFKLGFKPNVYEYIGEFDLVIDPKTYNMLLSNGTLSKEFKK